MRTRDDRERLRRNEREAVRAVRYFLRHRDYEQAFERLAWALRARVALEESARGGAR